jgi:hypothetical protein
MGISEGVQFPEGEKSHVLIKDVEELASLLGE